jgi:hypothetical protein
MSDSMIPYEYDRYMKTREKLDIIPFIKFPEDWEIQVIPPFGGATARFRVRKNNKIISAYLDCYDKLGSMGVPYWEIYPYNGDIYRCEMNEVRKLILAIGRELNRK